MRPLLGPLLASLILTACATPDAPAPALSVAGPLTTQARTAWLTCAHEKARTYPPSEAAIDRATVAVGACSHLRPAIVDAIKEENAGNRWAATYADTYTKALDKRAVALVADSLMRGSGSVQ